MPLGNGCDFPMNRRTAHCALPTVPVRIALARVLLTAGRGGVKAALRCAGKRSRQGGCVRRTAVGEKASADGRPTEWDTLSVQ